MLFSPPSSGKKIINQDNFFWAASWFLSMGIYYHPRHAISRELSPQLGLIRQIAPKYKKLKKLKIIDKDKVEQSVFIGVSKGADFKNSIYFVLRSLLHWA